MVCRARRLAILCGALGAFLGCSDSPTPTRPSVVPSPPPSGLAAGTILSVTSGEDGRPIAAAKVTVAGRAYLSDASGQLTLADPAAWGTLVDLVSPGFLDRQTLVRRDGGTRFVLWPLLPGMGFDEDYTAQLVYTFGTRDAPPRGSSPLRRMRPSTTQAFVLVTPEIWADEGMRAAHESGVALITAANGGRIVYGVGTARPTSGVVFEAKVDSAEPFCADRFLAFTQVSVAGNDIVGGRIVYCQPEAAKTETVTHELGHTFGLHHSLEWRELMAGVSQRGRAHDFGPRETLAMSLFFERRAGNRFPDNDRDIPASGRDTITIVCPESPGLL